ncbi:MAG: MAPEG family protein [Alcanivorax sp.]|nr:MAPEG family protein [Alcanivorax sp.]
MAWVAITTIIALLQCTLFSFLVGRARVKYQVHAPAISGQPVFDRVQRIHANTVEQLVVFLPALWLCGWFLEPRLAAAVGLLFIIGRQRYFNHYMDDPCQRGKGFLLGLASTLLLLLGALAGAILALLADIY